MAYKDTLKSKMNRVAEVGRSMTEMLGVLAIIGVLSIASVGGYRAAINKHKANQVIYDVGLGLAELKSMDVFIGETEIVAPFTPSSGLKTFLWRDDNANDVVLVNAISKATCERLKDTVSAEGLKIFKTDDEATLDTCTDDIDLMFTVDNVATCPCDAQPACSHQSGTKTKTCANGTTTECPAYVSDKSTHQTGDCCDVTEDCCGDECTACVPIDCCGLTGDKLLCCQNGGVWSDENGGSCCTAEKPKWNGTECVECTHMVAVPHTTSYSVYYSVSREPIECPCNVTSAARSYGNYSSVTGIGTTGCCPEGTTAMATPFNDASFCCPVGYVAFEGKLGSGGASYNGRAGAGCCPEGALTIIGYDAYCNDCPVGCNDCTHWVAVPHTSSSYVSTELMECPCNVTSAARSYGNYSSVTGIGTTGCCPEGTTAMATPFNDASFCCPVGYVAFEGKLGSGGASYNGRAGAGCCPEGLMTVVGNSAYCNDCPAGKTYDFATKACK